MQPKVKESTYEKTFDAGENFPMVLQDKPLTLLKHVKDVADNSFIFLLCLNTFISFVLFGILPPLSTYSLLPYGHKVFYYFCLLNPLSYSIALLISVVRATISICITTVGILVGCILAVFIIIIAAQSPCPWWADTLHGAVIILVTWFAMTLIMAYVRITIGNRIKAEWANEKGMFYFGITIQLGLLIGAVPMYLLVNVFRVFTDRQPCQIYCVA